MNKIQRIILAIKGTQPTPVDTFKVDRLNRIVYKGLNKEKYASEPLFTCTICDKRTCIESSFSVKGGWLMCNTCYNIITDEINDFPLTEYID